LYALHGRELMGCKSAVCESRQHRAMMMQTLANGKRETVKFKALLTIATAELYYLHRCASQIFANEMTAETIKPMVKADA